MIDYITLGLFGLSFVFTVLSLIFLIRYKGEEERIEHSLNITVFGVLFLALFLLTEVIVYLDKLFHEQIVKSIPLISTYVSYLVKISDLVFIPLVAICFLVAVLLLRE